MSLHCLGGGKIINFSADFDKSRMHVVVARIFIKRTIKSIYLLNNRRGYRREGEVVSTTT